MYLLNLKLPIPFRPSIFQSNQYNQSPGFTKPCNMSKPNAMKLLSKLKKKATIIWLLEKLLWLALIVGFGFLTAKSSITILLQYANGATSTSVERKFNSTITLSNATYCIPIYIDFLFWRKFIIPTKRQ